MGPGRTQFRMAFKNRREYYDTEIEAAKAYDQHAIQALGDKALLNFPPVHNQNTRYSNVDKRREAQLWRVQIKLFGKSRTVGYFDDKLKAAKVADSVKMKCYSLGIFKPRYKIGQVVPIFLNFPDDYSEYMV